MKPFGRRPDDKLIGMVLAPLAMGSFSISDAMSKLVTLDLDPMQVVWARFAFALLALSPFLILWGPRQVLSTPNPKANLLRAVGMFVSAFCFVLALSRLPLAVSIAISFVSPFIITALSIPLLSEKVGPRRWAAIAVGFLGILVVVRPGASGLGWAALLPLLSAAAWAVTVVVGRRVSTSHEAESPLTVLFYMALVGFCLSSLAVLPVWQPLPLSAVGPLALGALCFLGGHLLMVMALERAAASLLAPFSYSQMLWATLLGLLLFGYLPDRWTLVGTAVVMASGIYIFWREQVVDAMEARTTAKPASEAASAAPVPAPLQEEVLLGAGAPCAAKGARP